MAHDGGGTRASRAGAQAIVLDPAGKRGSLFGEGGSRRSPRSCQSWRSERTSQGSRWTRTLLGWAVLHEVALEDGVAQVDRRSNLTTPKIRDGGSPARGGGNIDAAGSDRAARASGWREDEATKRAELSDRVRYFCPLLDRPYVSPLRSTSVTSPVSRLATRCSLTCPRSFSRLLERRLLRPSQWRWRRALLVVRRGRRSPALGKAVSCSMKSGRQLRPCSGSAKSRLRVHDGGRRSKVA